MARKVENSEAQKALEARMLSGLTFTYGELVDEMSRRFGWSEIPGLRVYKTIRRFKSSGLISQDMANNKPLYSKVSPPASAAGLSAMSANIGTVTAGAIAA